MSTSFALILGLLLPPTVGEAIQDFTPTVAQTVHAADARPDEMRYRGIERLLAALEARAALDAR